MTHCMTPEGYVEIEDMGDVDLDDLENEHLCVCY